MAGPRKVRIAGTMLLAVVLSLSSPLVTSAQDNELPKPRQQPAGARAADGPDILPRSAVHDLDAAVPVTLPEVLKLASLANLDIAQANLVVERARASVLLAKSYYLPSLNLGSMRPLPAIPNSVIRR